MKEELQKEIDENRALRENITFIQDKYRNENQRLSSENGDLKLLAQKLRLIYTNFHWLIDIVLLATILRSW